MSPAVTATLCVLIFLTTASFPGTPLIRAFLLPYTKAQGHLLTGVPSTGSPACNSLSHTLPMTELKTPTLDGRVSLVCFSSSHSKPLPALTFLGTSRRFSCCLWLDHSLLLSTYHLFLKIWYISGRIINFCLMSISFLYFLAYWGSWQKK